MLDIRALFESSLPTGDDEVGWTCSSRAHQQFRMLLLCRVLFPVSMDDQSLAPSMGNSDYMIILNVLTKSATNNQLSRHQADDRNR
jgi:hypothetical protein